MATNGSGCYIAFEAAADDGTEYASTAFVSMCRIIADATNGGSDDRFQCFGINTFVDFGQCVGCYVVVYPFGSQGHSYFDASPARKAHLIGDEGVSKPCIVKKTSLPQTVDDAIGVG